jgi:hypothetical protein
VVGAASRSDDHTSMARTHADRQRVNTGVVIYTLRPRALR